MFRLLVMGVAVALAVSGQASDPRESAKQLVVRIEGKLNGATEVGAGLIAVVSPALDRVYIVTANHVVRMKDAANTPATDIKVQFRWSPEFFPAELMPEHFDKAADLAVLRLRNIKELGLPSDLPLGQVGASTGLRLQSKVYTLGFPNGRSWFLSATPDAISGNSSDSVRFQASFLAPGHSGGALLNENYQVVGMILEDAPPESKALRIEHILTQLQDWNYTPSLRPSGTAVAARRVLRLLYAEVIQDGSPGSTRWDLKSTVNGKQLFDWRSRECDDDRGKNRLTPDPGDAVMEVEGTGDLEIEVLADHSVGQPKPAKGKATLKSLGQTSVPVKAAVEKDGYFNFVFLLEEKK